MYTNVTKVRQVAGFVGNSNISDAFISSMITRAEGFINGYVGDVYILPLPKFYYQTIVFSGTGSGSDTLTITIDGEDYVVNVTAAMTAAQAADAFRTAALDNESFVTDGLGSGATVTLYTLDGDDSDEVTITANDSPQGGITATAGTVTETAVPTIEMLATEIAAAYLLIIQYGEEAKDTDKDGYKRLEIWEGMLENIRAKKEKVRDFSGTELPVATTRGIVFAPNNTTEEDTENPTHSRMTMNKKW